MQRLLCALLLTLLPFCAAAGPPEGLETDPASIPHPVILPDQRWPGALVLGILGWFVMAAVIGLVVRANAPEEALAVPSRREPPGDLPAPGNSKARDR